MKTIELTNGYTARVDDRNYEDLARFRWYSARARNTLYAARRCRHTDGHWTTEFMHRRILGLRHGDRRQADHINHNGLDNTRANLRIVTQRVNSANRLDQSRLGVGVYKDPRRTKRPYFAQWNDGRGQHHSVGGYKTPRAAAMRYDVEIRKVFPGQVEGLNFSDFWRTVERARRAA